MNKRIENISNWLIKENIDFAFINSVPNIFYLSGYTSNPMERLLALIVFKNVDPVLICPALEVEEVKSSSWDYNIISYTDNENPWDKIKEYFRENLVNNCKNFAVELEFITYKRFQLVQSLSPQASVKPVDQKLNELRLIKDETEIENMRIAAEQAEYCINLGLEAIKEGCTELDVLAHIEDGQTKNGIQRKSNRPLVLFGHNSSLPHGTPGNRKLKKGDFILMDLGVLYNGYCSDISRTFIFKSANDKSIEIYNTVLQANLSAIAQCQIGNRIGDLDITARNIIDESGYGKYFPHRVGHGLGIETHEHPSMSSNNDELLKEGMVFTIEPGIYIPGFGGVRIEDEVLVTKEGPRLLTSYNKELQIIE